MKAKNVRRGKARVLTFLLDVKRLFTLRMIYSEIPVPEYETTDEINLVIPLPYFSSAPVTRNE